ncbi:putative BEL1-like homeodomain 8 [Hibiscus syriacus]|nr:putative BEL1-like homeodomain 8 [Hibiscus syriacus]
MESSCLTAKVIKEDVPEHERTIVDSRRLLGKAKSGYPKESSVNNHHYIPRENFNYPGGDGDGSG